jgi:hypothetical protein
VETFYNEIGLRAGIGERKDLHRGHGERRVHRKEKSKSADAENAIRENGVPGEAKRDDNTEVTEGRT